MTFAEDLKAMIQQGKTEKAEDEQGGRDFESRWQDLRQSLVLRLFREASEVLKGQGFAAESIISNGSSVSLHAVWNHNRQHFTYSLDFRGDQEKRQVICSSSLSGEEAEAFDLAHLTEAAVVEKVKRFAYLVARGGESAYIGGVLSL